MVRRRSGWGTVMQVARAIDRANRAQQRANLSQQKALLREEEREHRQHQKEMNAIIKQSSQLQGQFNKAVNAADTATNLATKQSKLAEAEEKLEQLKKLSFNNSFLNLTNMTQVEDGIHKIKGDIARLREEKERNESLEKSAIRQTESANNLREAIANVLKHTLSVDDAIDWGKIKETAPFSTPEPQKPSPPMLPPKPFMEDLPSKPKKEKAQIPLLAHFLSKKKADIIEQAETAYKNEMAEWQKECSTIEKNNKDELNEWDKQKKLLLSEWEEDFKEKHKTWKLHKEQFLDAQQNYNSSLDALREQYKNKKKTAIEEHSSLVLSRSDYPFPFARDYELEYMPDSKVMALDYSLPTIEVVPHLKEAKYIKTKNEIKHSYITDKLHREIYDNLLYSMVLRTIHELFEADTANYIDGIVLNGWVVSLDKGTGHDVSRCILSISVKKEEFLPINLANIEPRECFKKLKGVGSSKLSELVPIAPILNLNKEDKRFVTSYDVTSKMQDGDNLAIMHWEDFEHLIRELFQKEFGAEGGEVNVTQASRDGGVDAVIFDPNPIRGGKIVVQAKRYTNTVGVSAVRDLYGTLINEGAMKGILITTSDYGPDAHHFSKGKPITLLNGNNLLHLLEKHGKKARIDIKEAKKFMAL